MKLFFGELLSIAIKLQTFEIEMIFDS